MSQEIEIEYKNLLNKEEYERVYQEFPFDQVPMVEQTNYYFETKELSLKQHGAALRIRYKNDSWVLTLKQPHEEGLLETHEELSAQEADLWIQNKGTEKPEVARQLQEFGVDIRDLRYLGSLRTRRKEMEYKGATIVLDHSLYGDQEDFELEVEAPTTTVGKAVIEEILQTCKIPDRKTDPKIKRFFEATSQSD